MSHLVAGTAFDDRDTYLLLVQRFALRPIRADEELADASEMLDCLLERDNLDSAEEDYLSVLERLIEEYETRHYPIPPLPDHKLLRELIDAKGVTQQEVARATGIVYSTISDVLRGRRKLTRDHIGRLCEYFSVSPNTFSFA